jgi:hypothetical protein
MHTAEARSWRRSSRCELGNCLEAAIGDAGPVFVRDTKDLGPVLRFDRSAWQSFVAAVSSGRLDAS